jgi:amino acid transporter
MAVAAVEERELLKTISWFDGFVVALANPSFLITGLGGSVLGLGGWGAVILWTVSVCIGALHNYVYSELAAMFPKLSGGIAIYAHEAWKKYVSFVGPLAAFGYWIGWSVVLSIFGNLIGGLITAQWFPGSKPGGTGPGYFSTGPVNIGLPQLIGVGLVVSVWLFNIFGVRPSLWVGRITGALLMIPLAVFIVVPYFTGDWHSSKVSYLHVAGHSDFSVAIVWLFILGWSSYAAEVCATFAPEFHDTKRDTALALRSSALFTLVVFLLLPLGLGGVTGAPGGSVAYGPFYVSAFKTIVGPGFGGVALVLLIAALVLSMNSSTADGGRALYGIARDGMTIKQLHHLNKFNVPARAMSVDMVVNVLLILFVANNLAILYMSNIGYVLAHVLALSGFVLLRKDRPNWPRPIKVGPAWVVGSALLAALNLFFLIFAVSNGALAALLGGYTFSGYPLYIGIGVLVAAVLLYFYRRAVQDHLPISFRDADVPTMPNAQQMALLRQEGVT